MSSSEDSSEDEEDYMQDWRSEYSSRQNEDTVGGLRASTSTNQFEEWSIVIYTDPQPEPDDEGEESEAGGLSTNVPAEPEPDAPEAPEPDSPEEPEPNAPEASDAASAEADVTSAGTVSADEPAPDEPPPEEPAPEEPAPEEPPPEEPAPEEPPPEEPAPEEPPPEELAPEEPPPEEPAPEEPPPEEPPPEDAEPAEDGDEPAAEESDDESGEEMPSNDAEEYDEALPDDAAPTQRVSLFRSSVVAVQALVHSFPSDANMTGGLMLACLSPLSDLHPEDLNERLQSDAASAYAGLLSLLLVMLMTGRSRALGCAASMWLSGLAVLHVMLSAALTDIAVGATLAYCSPPILVSSILSWATGVRGPPATPLAALAAAWSSLAAARVFLRLSGDGRRNRPVIVACGVVYCTLAALSVL